MDYDMENKKVLITGNRNYGLCKAICDLFDTVDNIDYSTASRSTGWDLDKQSEQDRLATHFVDDNFNIFIKIIFNKIYYFHIILFHFQ